MSAFMEADRISQERLAKEKMAEMYKIQLPIVRQIARDKKATCKALEQAFKGAEAQVKIVNQTEKYMNPEAHYAESKVKAEKRKRELAERKRKEKEAFAEYKANHISDPAPPAKKEKKEKKESAPPPESVPPDKTKD
jgi:hypothetical protein